MEEDPGPGPHGLQTEEKAGNILGGSWECSGAPPLWGQPRETLTYQAVRK